MARTITLAQEVGLHLEAYREYVKSVNGKGPIEEACQAMNADLDAKLVQKITELEQQNADLIDAISSMSMECIKSAHSTKWPHVTKMMNALKGRL